MLPVLEGVVMELQDCALPLLKGSHLIIEQYQFCFICVLLFVLFFCLGILFFFDKYLRAEVAKLSFFVFFSLLCFQPFLLLIIELPVILQYT